MTAAERKTFNDSLRMALFTLAIKCEPGKEMDVYHNNEHVCWYVKGFQGSEMSHRMMRDAKRLLGAELLAHMLTGEALPARRAATPEPQLPQCDGFQGNGARCAGCRIRKAMHN